MHNDQLLPPRDEILGLMERIYRFRMTTTSGGNLSLRDEAGDVWITPARVDKGSLRREDIVRVRPDGTTEGHRPPSSELPFHKAIYAARPDIGGIVHAHPVALVAFSLCRQVPDTRLFHQARHVCGDVGFAPYALPGSEALGQHIATAFARGHDCVILENHGVVTAGASLQNAFERFETLEFVARTYLKAGQIGQPHVLSEEQLRAEENADRSCPVGSAENATVTEKEFRRELSEFVRRGYRQRLLTSTQGSFSCRTGDDEFLITPYRGDRFRIESGDLVSVRRGWSEPGKIASRATSLHRAIYLRHPQVAAVINAFPVNGTAYSVTGQSPDMRAIPESYVVVRGIERIPFGLQFGDVDAVADRLSLSRPAALIENDGVLILGSNILDAFDRLEVLEATAEALIDSQILGGALAMSDSVIAELETAFALPRSDS